MRSIRRTVKVCASNPVQNSKYKIRKLHVHEIQLRNEQELYKKKVRRVQARRVQVRRAQVVGYRQA